MFMIGGGLLLWGAMLRFDGLDVRPVHADEATGGRILAERLEGKGYAYNPHHFHGPMLSEMAYPLAWLWGERSWKALEISTLRLSTALAGTLLLLTPLLWRRCIGAPAVLMAMGFLATSPLLVVYSRSYIHEPWLALFGMLACAGVYHLLQAPGMALACALGVCIGLMFATKITFVLSLFAWGVAAAGWWCLVGRRQVAPLRLTAYAGPLLCCGLSALGTAAFFYSSYFTHPSGFLEACRSFFVYEPSIGHEKAFGYYFWQMLWSGPSGGVWWSEAPLALAAVAAFWIHRKNSAQRALLGFLGVSVFLQWLAYSLIAYKTPWLMLLPWAQLCLMAGCLLTPSKSKRTGMRVALPLTAVLCLGYQGFQARSLVPRLENTPHNPYGYVLTSQDAVGIGTWLQALEAEQPIDAVAVVGSGYWPLPWYLKALDARIDYWPDGGVDLRAYSVVLAMPEAQSAVQAQLALSHVELLRSLRAQVPVFLFLQNERLSQWLAPDDG